MIIEEVKIADIKPYERNQKKHPESQVKNIAKSIEKYGFVQPIVIDKNNEIIIGHGRYMAGGDILGMETVPCVRAENLTEKQIRELRILDNKLNESEWDIDKLKKDIDELDFSEFDLDFDLDFEQELDEAIEEEEKQKPEVQFTEILNEENNYIVLKFNNSVDWLQACTLFELQPVKALSTRKDGKVTKGMERIGLGRVIDGSEAIKKLIGE